MFRKIGQFFVRAVIAAKDYVVNFVRNTYRHAETVAILVFASLGVNALIGELPFMMTLPMWIEGPMIIPVISVLAISLLVKSAEFRASRRLAKVAV